MTTNMYFEYKWTRKKDPNVKFYFIWKISMFQIGTIKILPINAILKQPQQRNTMFSNPDLFLIKIVKLPTQVNVLAQSLEVSYK